MSKLEKLVSETRAELIQALIADRDNKLKITALREKFRLVRDEQRAEDMDLLNSY